MLSTLLRTLQIGFKLAHIQNEVQENAGQAVTTVVYLKVTAQRVAASQSVCVCLWFQT